MDAYERKGVGYHMISELKTFCNDCDIGRYFLSSYQNNAGANALYKKLGGFVPEESQGNGTNYWFFTK